MFIILHHAAGFLQGLVSPQLSGCPVKQDRGEADQNLGAHVELTDNHCSAASQMPEGGWPCARVPVTTSAQVVSERPSHAFRKIPSGHLLVGGFCSRLWLQN